MSDTQEVILNRMLDDIPASYNKTKGEFIYDILSSAAKEFEKAYKSNENEIIKSHIDTAEGKDLDELVKKYANIERKRATSSSGEVEIKADLNATFRKGDLVSIGSINYAADKDYSSDSNGIITANVVCTITGAAGNTKENTIIYFPKTLSGLKAVTNTKPFTNGYDEETDEELRQRYYERVGDPETSGNSAQYKSWAKNFTGVGNAKIIECWNGPGTIKIIIIDSNKNVASDELCNTVKDYIETVRPACSGTLTVESAVSVELNINLKLEFDTTINSIDEIKKNIESTLTKYLKDISFRENTISYFAIAAKIFNCDGVKKLLELKINSSNKDIELLDNQITQLGSVAYE